MVTSIHETGHYLGLITPMIGPPRIIAVYSMEVAGQLTCGCIRLVPVDPIQPMGMGRVRCGLANISSSGPAGPERGSTHRFGVRAIMVLSYLYATDPIHTVQVMYTCKTVSSATGLHNRPTMQ
jgi:hypothetical protein